MDSKQLEKRKKVLLDLMNDKIYVPMKIKELAIILQVSKEERPDLELVLNELLAEGKIEISKRGKYKIAKEKTVTGTFMTHPKGFGFIEVEGRDDDIYVSEENIGNAFLRRCGSGDSDLRDDRETSGRTHHTGHLPYGHGSGWHL